MVVIGFAVAFSCTSALYIPSEPNLSGTATLAELQQGRKLYIRKCGSCHTLYLPQAYSPGEWKYRIQQMESKVSIDSIEKALILKYVSGGK